MKGEETLISLATPEELLAVRRTMGTLSRPVISPQLLLPELLWPCPLSGLEGGVRLGRMDSFFEEFLETNLKMKGRFF